MLNKTIILILTVVDGDPDGFLSEGLGVHAVSKTSAVDCAGEHVVEEDTCDKLQIWISIIYKLGIV